MTQNYFITARDINGFKQRFMSHESLKEFFIIIHEKLQKNEKVIFVKSIAELHQAEIITPDTFYYLIVRGAIGTGIGNLEIYSPRIPKYLPTDIVDDFKTWAFENGWVQFELPTRQMLIEAPDRYRTALRNEAYLSYLDYLQTDDLSYQQLDPARHRRLIDYIEQEGPYLKQKINSYHPEKNDRRP